MHLFPAGAGQVVSIHAPAWGATNAFAFRAYNYIVFQSTHPRGVRLSNEAFKATDIGFQSTHPRGVRRGHADACRTHYIVSIHAPAWGATSDVPAPNMQALVSIHAPAWGATPRNEAAFPAAPCFNPRTRVGCDARRMV